MSPDVMEKLIAALVGALFAAPLSGWIAWQYKGKELSRVELRARLTAIEAEVKSLRDKALVYWARDGNDEKSVELAREIKMKDRQLGQEIKSIYTSKGISYFSAEKYRMNFRMEMTGGDFEGINRKKSDARCNTISDKAGFLVDQIRRDFGIV